MPAMIVPGKLGLSSTKVKVFVGSPLLFGFFEGGLSVTVYFPVPITSMCAGTVTLIVDVNRLIP